MTRFLIFSLVSIISLVAIGGFLSQRLTEWSDTPLMPPEVQIVELPRGGSLKSLSQDLKNKNLVSHEIIFQYWVRYFSDYQKFQAGTYRFEEPVSPRELVNTFINGEIYQPVVFEYTIPEGFTLKQVLARLAAKGIATLEELQAIAGSREILAELRVESDTLEGYLYPATYSFTVLPTAREAIAVAVEEFWSRLPENYRDNVEAMGLSLNDAVTFASLIELETPHHDERGFVSEVIWRRLKANAPLAIDATIIYGIPDYNGNITRKHLRDASNPYNSRIHPGLPPTPIGSPSLQSLLAVLNPSNEGYYYYVVDVHSEGGNKHHFSKTLQEHNRYVRELVNFARRERRNKKQN
jgi:UPF0755 protein